MLIREPADNAEIHTLVHATQEGRSGFVVARRRNNHMTGDINIVGEIEGTAVAIGSLRGGPRHPRMVELSVDAFPSAGDEIAPLVDALVAAAGDRIIECKTADYDAISHWVRGDGRFAHEITVESGRISTVGRPPPGFLPVGYAVESLEEATPEVERLFERVYAESHAWTGEVVEFPETGSWLSVVGEPVAAGVVWNRTGEPVGVSGVVVARQVTQGAYLLPGGVLESERSHRPEMLGHAIEAALAGAARVGVRQVDYEDSRPDYALQGGVLDRFERTSHDITEMWISRDR
jgi:hypothetical protein